jgi:hypothetical protein
MQATLKFVLPEDQTRFEIASKSVELATALTQFRDWLEAMKLRSTLDRKSLQVIEAEFTGILDDFGIVLEHKEIVNIEEEDKRPIEPLVNL